MIRGGTRPGRIGRIAVCAVAAIVLAAPAAASGQAAVDEYTLDLPQAGGGGTPVDPGNPPDTGVASSGGGGAAGGGDGGAAGGGGGETKSDARTSESQPRVDFAAFHEGIGPQALDTTSRSAPEIIADSLLDGPMLPILAALALITAAGAWRVVRGRRTLTGQAG
jgi:hypothetical protein